jgi:lysozyme
MNPKQGWSDEAAFKLAPEWASFPTRAGRSYYDQPVKKLESMRAIYEQFLQEERQQGTI